MLVQQRLQDADGVGWSMSDSNTIRYMSESLGTHVDYYRSKMRDLRSVGILLSFTSPPGNVRPPMPDCVTRSAPPYFSLPNPMSQPSFVGSGHGQTNTMESVQLEEGTRTK